MSDSAAIAGVAREFLIPVADDTGERLAGAWSLLAPEQTEARERVRAIRCGDVRREMFHDLKPVYRWRWL